MEKSTLFALNAEDYYTWQHPLPTPEPEEPASASIDWPSRTDNTGALEDAYSATDSELVYAAL